jgi:PPOX class probable F420-dependent enzyme
MRLDVVQARERFAGARVARLATVGANAGPHIVPIVFALDDDVLYTAVDAKPKSSTALRRLDNIAANPAVAVLTDHYAEDWTQLWWARADGIGRVLHDDAAERAIRLLTERYEQYRAQPAIGPVIAIRVERWSGWQAAGPESPPAP